MIGFNDIQMKVNDMVSYGPRKVMSQEFLNTRDKNFHSSIFEKLFLFSFCLN